MEHQGFGTQTWECVEMVFVATSETQELSFLATGSNGRIALDGVRIARISQEPMQLVVGAVEESTMSVSARAIPSAELYELRWSEDGVTFLSFDPPVEFDLSTPQPIQVPVSLAEYPKFFVQAFLSCTRAPVSSE